MTLLPTRTYKPDDFAAECKRLQQTCTEIADAPLEWVAYKDADGNTYRCDMAEQTITVNGDLSGGFSVRS